VSFKPVLVHCCKGAEPMACRCHRHVTFRRAEQFVRDGHAIRRVLPTGHTSDREIILVRHEPLKPARTISPNDIQSAYVLQNDQARKRIEIYGGQL